jgi:3'(2'), 5'-bisphosphate nucleotidase
VHVALVVDSQPVAGAVALPAQGVTLSSDPSAVVPPAVDGPPRIVVSRTRPPAVATALADALGADLVAMGSAGAKAASVVQGKSDIYPHSGGQYEWDSCAPVAVAAAAGLHVSRIDGSALVYNNADPYLPDLLVCRPELAEQTLAAIAALEG